MSRALQIQAAEKGSIPVSTTNGAKAFLEARKQRLTGDTVREAGELKGENEALKQLVAEIVLKNRK